MGLNISYMRPVTFLNTPTVDHQTCHIYFAKFSTSIKWGFKIHITDFS